MKIANISDMHLLWDKPIARLDDTKMTLLGKLEFVLRWVKDNDAILLVAGDFTNKPRSWYLLPEIIILLKRYSVPVFAVFGQHDTYMRSEQVNKTTCLGILELAGLVTVLGGVPVSRLGEYLRLYGCSYGQEIPTPVQGYKNVLVLHAPIAEEAAWPGQNYMDALQFLKQHEFDYIVAGDIHQKFVKYYQGRYIMNSGPLIRKEATPYNFQHKPGFFVIDTDIIEEPAFVEVPHQKAELVLTRAHIEYKEEATNMLGEFIESVESLEIDEDADITENIWRLVKKNKIRQEVVDILSEVMAG